MDDLVNSTVPVTAVVTAYQRVEQTLETVRRIEACRPMPDEILVHVDANQEACASAVRNAFPGLGVLVSEAAMGPGGGRNKLIASAAHSIVASFDDDSYPIDPDYFARVAELFARFPEAAVICGQVYHENETVQPGTKKAAWVADFAGGACAYRREQFSKTGGYVPIPLAYGIEEVDLALRLHAQGGRVLQTSWLRVFHDTDRARHADPRVTAASIANLALLTYLRYPRSLWVVGVGQCIKRIRWLLQNGRHKGIVGGILSIPSHLLKHRSYRGRVPAKAVSSYLDLRRRAAPISWKIGENQADQMTPTAATVLRNARQDSESCQRTQR